MSLICRLDAAVHSQRSLKCAAEVLSRKLMDVEERIYTVQRVKTVAFIQVCFITVTNRYKLD
jgi:hypothetical protein